MRDPSPFTAVAAILARGYLRLLENRRDVGVSEASDGRNLLDVLAGQSPHGVLETAP